MRTVLIRRGSDQVPATAEVGVRRTVERKSLSTTVLDHLSSFRFGHAPVFVHGWPLYHLLTCS